MYSSFNRFDHNLYRDATIVTTLDTFTSLLAGFTIFGVLGHLAYITGATDIRQVVQGEKKQTLNTLNFLFIGFTNKMIFY